LAALAPVGPEAAPPEAGIVPGAAAWAPGGVLSDFTVPLSFEELHPAKPKSATIESINSTGYLKRIFSP